MFVMYWVANLCKRQSEFGNIAKITGGSRWDSKLGIQRRPCLKSNEPAIRYDHYQLHQKSSGKGSQGRGQRIISLNTSIDVIRVPKARTSGK